MSVIAGVERPLSGVDVPNQLENYRLPLSTTGGAVTAQTVRLSQATATLTSVSTTIYAASVILPINLPVNNLTLIVTTAGTVTGFWTGLVDAGLIVRAVSANTTAPATGLFTQSVLPSSSVPYRTPYSGLYYVIWGTVSSVVPVIAANAALASAAAAGGPPVFCGTSATAATTTPPILGAQLGALTASATAEFYAHLT